MIQITFSWDDGSVEDLKLMDLSLKYMIPGIFFIPATNPERPVMSINDIRIINGNDFEIGAHTYSHSYLTQLQFNEAKSELLTGKQFLEQTLGKEIPHFCFPGGKHNPNLVTASKMYYKSARTADTGAIVGHDSYIIRPTFHFYDRGIKSLIFNSVRNHSSLFKLSLKNLQVNDYFELIKRLIADLDRIPYTNKIIIWGHSWEIEDYQLWEKLEDLFKFIHEQYAEKLFGYTDLLRI